MAKKEQRHIYHYEIDRRGNWTCEGNPVTDPELVRLLSRSLFIKEGAFFVRCEGEVHPVEVADAPLTVSGVNLEPDGRGGLLSAEVVLTDGRVFPLTDSLSASKDNFLYVKIGRWGLWARFRRRPYYELTAYLKETEGRYYIEAAGKRFFIGRRE